MNLNDLKSERALLIAAAEAITNKSEMTAEDTTAFDAHMSKVGALNGQIDRIEALKSEAAKHAVPVSDTEASKENLPEAVFRVAATPINHTERKAHNMAVFGGMIGALLSEKGNKYAAGEYAKKSLGSIGGEVSAALATGTSSGGGILVPVNLAQTVIERLVPNAVIRKMGARSLPLNNGNLTLPRINAGATAGYVGRDADIGASAQTFNNAQLTAKKLACLVPISNDLIRFAGTDPRVDSMIVEDTAISMANAEDGAFIRADGTGNTPTGLRYQAMSGNLLVPTNVGTIATPLITGQALIQAIISDAGKAILALRRANVRMVNPGWLMHPDSVQFLGDLLTTTGNKVFPEIADNMFRGFPIGMTTEIPTNLTVNSASGNGSEIYFVDFNEMIIGESLNMSVSVSQEAMYNDGSGNQVSAFQRDETLIRIITENDFAARHVEAIAVINGVTWYR